jgi:hypothetical protein
MSARPQYLVIVTHKGQDRLDLFSAHCVETEADTMYGRLKSLLRSTDSSVHMLTVPENAGVIDTPAPPPVPFAPVKTADKPKVVRKKLSQEEFEEETRAMVESGNSVIISDEDDVGYSGAFS